MVKESKRYYPYEAVLSHVLGYVGIDNQGLSGLELYYDNYLTGEDGSIKYFSDGKVINYNYQKFMRLRHLVYHYNLP